MLPWEKQTMHANRSCLVPKGTGQLNCTCKRLINYWEKIHISGREVGWMPRGIAQFLGRVADCCLELHNFWVEQLTAAHNCTISGLSRPAGRNCTIFWVKLGWQICAIMEPNRFPNRIVQFLEGRLLSLQNCVIS